MHQGREPDNGNVTRVRLVCSATARLGLYYLGSLPTRAAIHVCCGHGASRRPAPAGYPRNPVDGPLSGFSCVK